MVALDVITILGCQSCAKAQDAWGRDCSENILTPVMVVMSGRRECPFRKLCKPSELTERYAVRQAEISK